MLTLNTSKTSFIQFSNARIKQPDVVLRLHTCEVPSPATCSCQTITKTAMVKYLGVILDEKISWLPHINMITSRVRKLTWVFKNLRFVADFEVLRGVYYALVQSVIGYCIRVWGGACKTHLLRLERSQRSLLKTMTIKPFRFPTKALYELCQVFTVRQLYIYHAIVKLHVTTTYKPDNVRQKRTVTNVLNYIRCNTTLARRQYRFLSTHIYNKLNKVLKFYPVSLRECQSKLKSWLVALNYEDTEKIIH